MSGIRSLYRGPSQKGAASAASAPVRVDDTTQAIMVNVAGTGTAEVPVSAAAGAGAAAVVITTKTVLAAESGKTFYLDLAAGFVVTLPAVAIGLRYKFIIRTSVTGSITIVCPAAAALFKGHVLSSDLNAASDSDFDTTAVATITFVLNKSVVGDSVILDCDGVNWFYSAECSVFDAITAS